jgi:hypothetical protein
VGWGAIPITQKVATDDLLETIVVDSPIFMVTLYPKAHASTATRTQSDVNERDILIVVICG